jgi:hypothetical protein
MYAATVPLKPISSKLRRQVAKYMKKLFLIVVVIIDSGIMQEAIPSIYILLVGDTVPKYIKSTPKAVNSPPLAIFVVLFIVHTPYTIISILAAANKISSKTFT